MVDKFGKEIMPGHWIRAQYDNDALDYVKVSGFGEIANEEFLVGIIFPTNRTYLAQVDDDWNVIEIIPDQDVENVLMLVRLEYGSR